MWEAIETYMERKQPLIVIAGADYGQGSSRDWAAKGVRLAGGSDRRRRLRAHPPHQPGRHGRAAAGVQAGVNRLTLGIDGTETFDVSASARRAPTSRW
jgi:hypothetical protein